LSLFIRLIASHLCGDIVSYSPFLARVKRSEALLQKTGGLVLHGLVHGLFVWLWLWGLGWELKIWASLYVFVTHFLIDFSRVWVESAVIDRREFVILKRNSIWLYLIGRGDVKTETFMKKHLRTWALINMADQCCHVLAIGVFVLLAPV